MRFFRTILFVCAATLLVGSGWSTAFGAEAAQKIGIISPLEVLFESAAGQEVKKTLEAEFQKLQSSLQQDKEVLEALQADIQKKVSVWSDDTRQQKESELQKKAVTLKNKKDLADMEMEELQSKLVAPIFKAMEAVIDEIGKEKGFSLIMDSRAGVLFMDEGMDISALVVQRLNERLAGTKAAE